MTIKRRDILTVAAYDGSNADTAGLFERLTAEKKLVVVGPGDGIKSLILTEGGGGVVCYAVEFAVRSLLKRLEKGLYLNL